MFGTAHPPSIGGSHTRLGWLYPWARRSSPGGGHRQTIYVDFIARVGSVRLASLPKAGNRRRWAM